MDSNKTTFCHSSPSCKNPPSQDDGKTSGVQLFQRLRNNLSIRCVHHPEHHKCQPQKAYEKGIIMHFFGWDFYVKSLQSRLRRIFLMFNGPFASSACSIFGCVKRIIALQCPRQERYLFEATTPRFEFGKDASRVLLEQGQASVLGGLFCEKLFLLSFSFAWLRKLQKAQKCGLPK